jgi:hypothetical protein
VARVAPGVALGVWHLRARRHKAQSPPPVRQKHCTVCAPFSA